MLWHMAKTRFVHHFNAIPCGYFKKSTSAWIAIIRAVDLPLHSPSRMLKRSAHILLIPTTALGQSSGWSVSLHPAPPADADAA